jgi:threonine dehydratase
LGVQSKADRPPDYNDVLSAAKRLRGEAARTPLLEARGLAEESLGRVFLKPEVLQVTGSFKYRGAFNKISVAIETDPGLKGVVAFSSGNHAQGVAAAARRLGKKATIVMPNDAPAIKIENTRAYGAELVLYDRYSEDREAIARAIAAERDYVVVAPYDDPAVIAGQGTTGLEIAEDVAALGVAPDFVMVPCSGGGLVAGIALALQHQFPEAKVYACEPDSLDDTARSLKTGTRQRNAPDARSICDALMSATPGELTFGMNKKLLAGGLAASEAEVLRAMAVCLRKMKLVVEPGGAVALAALLARRVASKGKTSVVVLSGGNADDRLIERALRENPA